MTQDAWWRQASFYQIYPRSFADTNVDGEGDLRGVISKISYLQELGVQAVWLSPFYPSPLADGGYDVADPRNIDPRFGTLEDFDDMVCHLHDAGIKVVVDVVPNHVSVEHTWFKRAQEHPDDEQARSRFHIRDGRGVDGAEPPNNWISVFGGPAWSRLADGQWYLHLFDSSQPDLNWDNPEVIADGLKTLQFWLDRGVDGFRVDVAFGLKKDMTYADHHNPQGLIDAMRLDLFDPERDPALPNPREVLLGGPFFDRDEVHEIYRGWRELMNQYSPERMSVAEAWAYPASRAMDYAREDELHQVFNFDFMVTPYKAAAVRKNAQEVLDTVALVNAPATWVLSNHDSNRVVTRLGGLDRAMVMAGIAHGLPGGVYVYQGEELGLADAEIAPEHRQDPIFFRTNGRELGRDGGRVPLPWNSQVDHYGFSTAPDLWLPQPRGWESVCAEVQHNDSGSPLNFYRQLLTVRRAVHLLVDEQQFAWLTADDDVVAFSRGEYLHVYANLGQARATFTAPTGWRVAVIWGSADLESGELGANSVVWLVSPEI